MKKTFIKVAVVLLAGQLFNVGGFAQNDRVAAATATAQLMKDNLSKYGLVKDVELPVTVTAGGLSYTLEKIMIYDTNSTTAQALIKKYGYTGTEGRKYFIWTKITVANNSKSVVQFGSKDLSDKWRLHFGEEAWTTMPRKFAEKVNNPEALWAWELAPGKKLSTYQAFTYTDDFKWFVIWVDNKSASGTKYVVKKPE